MSKPPHFTGMIWSLIGLIYLHKSEFNYITEQDPNKFIILTNRLNQDPFENMISIIKQKNSYTRNQTTKMIQSCSTSTCLYSLMKASDKCNFEVDEENCLMIGELERSEVTKTIYNSEMDTHFIN